MTIYSDILMRVEEVRQLKGLSKSRFAATIGMKPQTYNNFVGVQGSKPNVHLIHGIVTNFGVNPMWLLNGVGHPFSDELQSAEHAVGGKPPRLPPRVVSGRKKPSQQEILATISHELGLLVSEFNPSTTPLLSEDWSSDRQVQHAVQVMKHYFFADPAGTARQAVLMLTEFRQIADNMLVFDRAFRRG